MEIFKLFEATIAEVQPGHINIKDLRRDELLDNYDEATKTLQTLIKAKENEITYRRDLVGMLEKSKIIYDNKLMRAKQAYQNAKKHAPESLDLKGSIKKVDSNVTSTSASSSSTIAPPPPVAAAAVATTTSSSSSSITPTTTNAANNPIGTNTNLQQSLLRNSDLDIPLPGDSVENRSSLDRRLSEFLKTFPNLTQAGLAPPSANNNDVKPLPGYYTQQPPPPPISATPPLMAMMRFPPPPLLPPGTHPPPLNSASQENHDAADMDLSDYDESSNNGGTTSAGPAAASGVGLIPMVASAMQQGAGGKQHLRAEAQQSYVAGQQFNNPIQYAPRLNPLPFDPSIMEPRLGGSSSSSGSRDKHSSHSDRSGHRHSGGSSGSGSTSSKHGSDKNKYSSSSTSSHSSSNRSKRR